MIPTWVIFAVWFIGAMAAFVFGFAMAEAWRIFWRNK